MKRDGTGCAVTFVTLLALLMVVLHYAGCGERRVESAEDRLQQQR